MNGETTGARVLNAMQCPGQREQRPKNRGGCPALCSPGDGVANAALSVTVLP
jgi:hypothetical protein